jgi:hypothetical protein
MIKIIFLFIILTLLSFNCFGTMINSYSLNSIYGTAGIIPTQPINNISPLKYQIVEFHDSIDNNTYLVTEYFLKFQLYDVNKVNINNNELGFNDSGTFGYDNSELLLLPTAKLPVNIVNKIPDKLNTFFGLLIGLVLVWKINQLGRWRTVLT